MSPLDLFTGDDRQLIEQAIQQVFVTGENTAEAEFSLKNGGKVPYFFTGRKIDLDGAPCLIGMGVDISDRKQAEEELRLAAHKWRTTFDAIGDAVCLVDQDLKIIQCNQAMVNLAGKPFAEIIGSSWQEVMQGTASQPPACACNLMSTSRHRETVTLPLGDRWLHVIADPILDAAEEFAGGVCIIADITEYQHATQRISNLNALLKAIKNINESLLRVENEADLYRQTCDLLLGVPYVRFAWIGLVQPESVQVKPVAWAGVEDGYLSEIKVTWDDSVFGSGPTGEAFRTGRPYVRNDIAADPHSNPWRDAALQRGYLSSITLPLIHVHEVIGILKVYSAKTAAFGAEEIDFLNQIAGDIAVGVKSLRLEQGLENSLKKLRAVVEQTAEAIATMVELRDPYTAGHQRGVTQLACALAAEMGLDEERIEGIRLAGLLHDIGKVVVPAEILNKPGKLTELEFNIIRSHSQMSYNILEKIEFPWPVAQIALQHHELMNGSGYPAGLTGEDILLEARILAVADVVDAMTGHRPYRPALGVEKALEELFRNQGILYDPLVVEACIRLYTEKGYTPG